MHLLLRLVTACLLGLSLLPLTATAQTEAWIKGFGGPDFEYGRFVEPTADGGFAVGGTKSKFAGSVDDDFWVARFDSTGEIMWEKTYGHEDVGHTIFTFSSTSDGGFMIGGFTGRQFSGTESALMYRIDSLGEVVWEYDVDYSSSDHWHLLLEHPSGGYFFGGHTDSKNDPTGDAWLVRLDEQREVVWEKYYDRGTPEHAHAGIITRDGGAFLLGHTEESNLEKFWAVKVDSMGTVQWNRVLSSGPAVHDSPYDVFETREGRYAMVGGRGAGNTGQGWLIVVDTAGRTVIDKRFGNSAASSFSWSGRQTRDGGYVLIGHTNYRTEGALDMYVVKTDSAGNVEWEHNYGGTSLDYGFDIVEVSDGFIAVGLTRSPELTDGFSDDLLLVKIVPEEVRPVAVQLQAPSNVSTGIDVAPTLSWLPVDGATRYEVQVATDAGFGVLVFADTSVTSTSVAVSDLAPGRRHWWRVRATNELGWGPYSTTWTFTTRPPVSSSEAAIAAVTALHVIPNPASADAVVAYTIARPGPVALAVFDANGVEVGSIDATATDAGSHRTRLPLETLAAGVYSVRLTQGAVVLATSRFVVVR